MAETPADVYRDAAKAWLDADEDAYAVGPTTRAALVRLQLKDERFRAAVDAAFGAGRDYEAKGGWR
jgi:hypothetical protein